LTDDRYTIGVNTKHQVWLVRGKKDDGYYQVRLFCDGDGNPSSYSVSGSIAVSTKDASKKSLEEALMSVVKSGPKPSSSSFYG
jgi:hypothetical protein